MIIQSKNRKERPIFVSRSCCSRTGTRFAFDIGNISNIVKCGVSSSFAFSK